MPARTVQPLDLDALPPAVRKIIAGAAWPKLRACKAQTERPEIAQLRHALYGKWCVQLAEDGRQLAFEYLKTAVAEAEASLDAAAERNADGKPRRPVAKRNLGHLPRIEQVIEPEQKICSCGCTDIHQAIWPPVYG